jgi:hypothetical protein
VFRSYDDEGYMLLSLKGFLSGHPLYSETYSQYGPFHSIAQAFQFRALQLPVTHDAGRLVTFLDWMIAGGIAGIGVYRASRNLLLTAAGVACHIVLGSVLVNEPGHPQQVIMPLLLLSGLASLWAAPGSIGRVLFMMGALGSALVFTKINLGIFYFAALSHACIVLLPRSRIRSVLLWLCVACASILPYAIMRGRLTDVLGYCLAATLCISVVLTCGGLSGPVIRLPGRAIVWGSAGALVAGSLIVAASLLEGISLQALLNGVVLDPARHPALFILPVQVSMRSVAITAFVLACSMGLFLLASRDRLGTYVRWVGAVQLLAGLLAIALILSSHLSWALPFVPLVLLPGRSTRGWPKFSRIFLADLAVMQFLGAYPVAGSQVSMAAVPGLFWAFVCVADGADSLAASLRWYDYRSILRASAILVLAAAAYGMWRNGLRLPPYSHPKSGLAGASSIHMPEDVAGTYRYLSANVKRNCDLLFTMPGMGSFNLWSGVPQPDWSNLTAWMQYLSLEKQARILDALRANQRACVIYNPRSGWFLGSTPETLAVSSGLVAYIVYEMPGVVERDGYEIRVHPQRRSSWLP